MSSSSAADVRVATAATVDVVLELSQALRCGLDRKAVQILMALIDAGLQPAALARAVRAAKHALTIEVCSTFSWFCAWYSASKNGSFCTPGRA